METGARFGRPVRPRGVRPGSAGSSVPNRRSARFRTPAAAWNRIRRSRASAANSSFIAAWPSKVISCPSPHRAATASKSRPMLLVRGELILRPSMAPKTRCSASENHLPVMGDRFSTCLPSNAWGPKISYNSPSAERRGWRAAPSPPGNGKSPQMGHAPVIPAAAAKGLAAPDRAVRTVARTVPREPQHGPLQTMFRHAGSHVGVVMLYADDGSV